MESSRGKTTRLTAVLMSVGGQGFDNTSKYQQILPALLLDSRFLQVNEIDDSAKRGFNLQPTHNVSTRLRDAGAFPYLLGALQNNRDGWRSRPGNHFIQILSQVQYTIIRAAPCQRQGLGHEVSIRIGQQTQPFDAAPIIPPAAPPVRQA